MNQEQIPSSSEQEEKRKQEDEKKKAYNEFWNDPCWSEPVPIPEKRS